MKSFKKIFAFVLVFVMMAAIGVTASATGTTYTITINNNATGHTYEAYQVFTGDLSNGVLSNVQWGSGVNSTALLAALQADTAFGTGAANIFASATNAAGVADALDGLTDDSAIAKEFAQVVGQNLSTTIAGTSTYNTANTNYTISGLAAGYYFVKDQSTSLNGDEDAYTRYVLKVVNNVTVTPKSSVPSVMKKVKDINDSTETALSAWQDSADHDIGDVVQFQLTGTLPTNYADYASYAYIFHDTQSTGLTFDATSVKVYVGSTEITNGFTVVTTGLADGCTFEVRFADLKTITGATITYDSKIIVTYTSTLNANAVLGSAGNPNQVFLTYSNNPNTGNLTDTGKTSVDRVIVFTYKTVVNKVDAGGTALTGAAFTLEKLYKGTGTDGADVWTAVTAVTNEAGTVFTFTGLDDGIYRLTETTTPAGYNTIDPIYFTVTAAHDVSSDLPTLTSLSASQSTAAGASLTEGIIATFTATLTDGSVSTNITNNSGATLPSTGGIGTTIFYIVGGLLMAAAVVLLVTKKKMSARQD